MTLRQEGTLARWNDERGFGFIAPASGGDDLFVHISALPRGQRPAIGERVTFEVDSGEDGRKRAVRVILPDSLQLVPAKPAGARRSRSDSPRHPAPARRPAPGRQPKRSFPLGGLLVVFAVIAVAIGFNEFRQRPSQPVSAATTATNMRPAGLPAVENTPRFQCDGRIHCSQMRSCEEATFFLRNCPGTKMDGDGDGIPCERQLCAY